MSAQSESLVIPTAEVFAPLLAPARYKAAFGGRGSGKSHWAAENLIDDAMRFPGEAGEGLRGLCVREIQKSLKQSAKFLIESKLKEFRLGERDGFKVFATVIKTPGDGVLDFQGMQDHTADSIKCYEGFHRASLEEAQTISITSLNLLRPTIRWEDTKRGLESEIWAIWNPRKKSDPIDVMLRGDNMPTDAVVVKANWSDNPWFPRVLEQERQDCLRTNPSQYDHIWEGGYVTVMDGAYWAEAIQTARLEHRIGKVAADPLMKFRLFADLGGTGAKSDAFALWVSQFVGKEDRTVNYYEAQGQPIATHIAWMREQGYTPENSSIWLPHDGETNDRVYDVSFQSAFEKAGYTVEVVPNQGKGAARQRIEAAHRTWPNVWMDEAKCQVHGGLDALGWYHEKKDEARQIGLGPDHDWSSHSADAWGLKALVYEKHTKTEKPGTNPNEAFRRKRYG